MPISQSGVYTHNRVLLLLVTALVVIKVVRISIVH